MLEVVDLFLRNHTAEGIVDQNIRVGIVAYGRNPETGDLVLYDDCSDLNFDVKLSNKKDFEYVGKSGILNIRVKKHHNYYVEIGNKVHV